MILKSVNRFRDSFPFKLETEDSLDRILASLVKLSRHPPEKGTAQGIFLFTGNTRTGPAVDDIRWPLNGLRTAVAN